MCVEKTTLVKGSFLFLGRIWYTKLVNIITVIGNKKGIPIC